MPRPIEALRAARLGHPLDAGHLAADQLQHVDARAAGIDAPDHLILCRGLGVPLLAGVACLERTDEAAEELHRVTGVGLAVQQQVSRVQVAPQILGADHLDRAQERDGRLLAGLEPELDPQRLAVRGQVLRAGSRRRRCAP